MATSHYIFDIYVCQISRFVYGSNIDRLTVLLYFSTAIVMFDVASQQTAFVTSALCAVTTAP